MVNQSGGNWIEPVDALRPGPRSGKQIVEFRCSKCHATGEGGAPRIGDRAAWIPRLRNGFEQTVRSAINGHGGMPARGGLPDLTDHEIRSAIVYMFNPDPVATK
jgi:cytochrome c5